VDIKLYILVEYSDIGEHENGNTTLNHVFVVHTSDGKNFDVKINK
jgi:hypothetical protein